MVSEIIHGVGNNPWCGIDMQPGYERQCKLNVWGYTVLTWGMIK
jgi:hypothetical protein